VHALWQPKDFAGRQRSPHAAEHDDDESGATALTEGVGATAGGRGKRLRRGKYGWDRIARQPPVEGSHVGRRQQNRRATSFLVPSYKCRWPSYARDRHGFTQLRAYLPRLTRYASFWTYVVAPVTRLARAAGHLPSCSKEMKRRSQSHQVAGKNARVRWWASSPKGAIILTSRARA